MSTLLAISLVPEAQSHLEEFEMMAIYVPIGHCSIFFIFRRKAVGHRCGRSRVCRLCAAASRRVVRAHLTVYPDPSSHLIDNALYTHYYNILLSVPSFRALILAVRGLLDDEAHPKAIMATSTIELFLRVRRLETGRHHCAALCRESNSTPWKMLQS